MVLNIFQLFCGGDINKEIEEMKSIPGAVLLDVRSENEFAGGHIPGSINIPVEKISEAEHIIRDHNTPVFVYCLRGTRSRRAAGALKKLGYLQVKSIGGIAAYTGETE